MALTKESIDQIWEAAQYGVVDTVKQLRYSWPMGLKEAITFVRKYAGNVEGLRKALCEMANLKEGMVFENSFIRIEFKTADASFQEIRQFLLQALETAYPKLSFEEVQEFCMQLIWQFKGRPTTEELQQLFANFSDRFYPEFKLEEVEPFRKE